MLRNIKVKDTGTNYTYYENSLRLMILRYTTGNSPNLYNYSPQNLKSDANSDSAVDALDYAAIKKALLTQSLSEIDTTAADMNDAGETFCDI